MSVLVKSAFILLMLENVMADQESYSSIRTCEKPNEEFKACGTACPLTCANFINPPTQCTEQCIVGCACKEGFVRDAINGNCVAPEKCTGFESEDYE